MGSSGNKKLPPCGIPRVGITESTPHISSPWWSRLPLLQCGIYGSAQSDTGNLFQRGWPRALWLGLIKIVKITRLLTALPLLAHIFATFFNKLHDQLTTYLLFVLLQSLIARNVHEVFSSNHGISG